MPANDDLDLLIAAARVAGEMAMGYWQSNPKTWEKDDGAGPVTEADLAVDTYLRETLGQARPDYGWLSEETTDNRHRLQCAQVFIVDPIDGTRSFIEGAEHWSHSLALTDNGEVTAAVVYLPVMDKMYTAVRGGGAWLNGKPLQVNADKGEDDATLLATRGHLDPVHWPGGAPTLRRHFYPSLAYRMALVAEGRFDGMLTLRDTWEWDVAAGTLLCLEAGATVSDRRGGAARFNNAHPALRGMVAAAPKLHAALSHRLGVA